ncbi:hypothetical protein OH492_20330 [Vibrio chagasii]|nr:hypothetical protein [Vibrio chagasii]
MELINSLRLSKLGKKALKFYIQAATPDVSPAASQTKEEPTGVHSPTGVMASSKVDIMGLWTLWVPKIPLPLLG